MPHHDHPGGPANAAPAADASELIEFLRCRLAQDRAALGEDMPLTGPQHQVGTLQRNTVLLGPGRMYAHLDAIETTIGRYESAMDWVGIAVDSGQDSDLHRTAAAAYLDSLRLHAQEWSTHPAYSPGWQRS